jgi:hypothetical protein
MVAGLGAKLTITDDPKAAAKGGTKAARRVQAHQ